MMGLHYLDAVLDRPEAGELVQAVDDVDWSTAMSRRVQQYGWLYDYEDRWLSETPVASFPDWLNDLSGKVLQHAQSVVIGSASEILPFTQAIINEYEPGLRAARLLVVI